MAGEVELWPFGYKTSSLPFILLTCKWNLVKCWSVFPRSESPSTVNICAKFEEIALWKHVFFKRMGWTDIKMNWLINTVTLKLINRHPYRLQKCLIFSRFSVKRHFKDQDYYTLSKTQFLRKANTRRQSSELECTAFIFNNTTSLHWGAAVFSYLLMEKQAKTNLRFLPHVHRTRDN